MTAIEFRTSTDKLTTADLSTKPHIPKDIGKRVQQYCLEHDLVLLTTSCFDTIRFIPPLVITEEEMARGIEIFKRAVEAVAEEKQEERATGKVAYD
jgi:4-aminobutyrate aminotransferase